MSGVGDGCATLTRVLWGDTGILLGVPIAVGFVVSRIFAEPFYEVAQRYNPQIFALSDREKIEGAKEVR